MRFTTSAIAAVYPRRGRRIPPRPPARARPAGTRRTACRRASRAACRRAGPWRAARPAAAARRSSAFSLSASPLGTVTNRSRRTPAFTSRAAPFHTSIGLHRLACAVELHAVEELVAPVEQLVRFLRARRLRGRAEQHREQPPAAAVRRGDQAIARGLGVAGLHAVDARVEPQQPVAVGLGDVVVAEFLLRVVLRVLVRESRGSARAASRYRSCAVL